MGSNEIMMERTITRNLGRGKGTIWIKNFLLAGYGEEGSDISYKVEFSK